jgi:hypothetical protein
MRELLSTARAVVLNEVAGPGVAGCRTVTPQPAEVRLSRTSTVVPPCWTAVPVLVVWVQTTRTLAESVRMPPYWASTTWTTASSAAGVRAPVSPASLVASEAVMPRAVARVAAWRVPPWPAFQVPNASMRRTAASFAAGSTSLGPGRHGTAAGSAGLGLELGLALVLGLGLAPALVGDPAGLAADEEAAAVLVAEDDFVPLEHPAAPTPTAAAPSSSERRPGVPG